MTIQIHDGVRVQMLKHAEQSYPHESCGFILGTVCGKAGLNTGHSQDLVSGSFYYPCVNRHQSDQQRRFLIDPDVYRQVEDEADAKGLTIVSIVHSHPNHSDQPSTFDLQHAWPGLSYIIISVCAGQVRQYHSWRLADDRSMFHQEMIKTGE